MKFSAKTIAYAGVTAALLIGGKFALSFIPNVEIVSPIIMLSATFLGLSVSLPAAVVFCLTDAAIYGFMPTVFIQYLFHFTLLSVAAYIFTNKSKDILALIIVSAVFSILFWVETPVINAIVGFSLFLPTLISGIPFMLLQCVSSLCFTLALYKPIKALSSKLIN